MAGVNKVILVGNLGADPEIRYLPTGGAVANLSLATSESWKDKQTGERQERTEWHRISLFGRQAEIAGEYLRKGSKIYLEGRIRTRKWQDQSGQDRYTTEIIGDTLQMLDRSNQSGGDFQSNSSPNQSSGEHYKNAPETSNMAPAPAGDFNDDIPF